MQVSLALFTCSYFLFVSPKNDQGERDSFCQLARVRSNVQGAHDGLVR